MCEPMSRLDRFRAWWSHAFAIEGAEEGLDPEERALVERLARFVVRRRMSTPALMILESGRPLNFLGSQVLAFFGPFLKLVFSEDEYDRFVRLLERRRSIGWIIDAIAEQEGGENE